MDQDESMSLDCGVGGHGENIIFICCSLSIRLFVLFSMRSVAVTLDGSPGEAL